MVLGICHETIDAIKDWISFKINFTKKAAEKRLVLCLLIKNVLYANMYLKVHSTLYNGDQKCQNLRFDTLFLNIQLFRFEAATSVQSYRILVSVNIFISSSNLFSELLLVVFGTWP